MSTRIFIKSKSMATPELFLKASPLQTHLHMTLWCSMSYVSYKEALTPAKAEGSPDLPPLSQHVPAAR